MHLGKCPSNFTDVVKSTTLGQITDSLKQQAENEARKAAKQQSADPRSRTSEHTMLNRTKQFQTCGRTAHLLSLIRYKVTIEGTILQMVIDTRSEVSLIAE